METYQEERLKICKNCGIYSSSNTTCNSSLYVNPENNDVSSTAKPGYIKGCGCFIPNKIKRETNHCPANKW